MCEGKDAEDMAAAANVFLYQTWDSLLVTLTEKAVLNLNANYTGALAFLDMGFFFQQNQRPLLPSSPYPAFSYAALSCGHFPPPSLVQQASSRRSGTSNDRAWHPFPWARSRRHGSRATCAP